MSPAEYRDREGKLRQGYMARCWHCGVDVHSVNMLGMGTCEKCGVRTPQGNQKSPPASVVERHLSTRGEGLIARMFDRSRQISFTDEDFQASVARFASYLDVDGLAHVTLAAEGSAHKILAMEAAHLAGSTVGAEPPGAGELAANSHTLWVINSWTPSAYWCATRAFHDPEFVREKLCDNPVDANAIAVWMNRVEVARGATFADEVEGGIRELERRCYERLGRAHFDEEPPR